MPQAPGCAPAGAALDTALPLTQGCAILPSGSAAACAHCRCIARTDLPPPTSAFLTATSSRAP